jgi:hypothetical protein
MHENAYRKTRVGPPVSVRVDAHLCTDPPTSELLTIRPGCLGRGRNF